ncbi:phosphoribosylpyrophosphate synthetase [Sphingobacterium sp. UT-1RO-CII-1]|uniref:phosphoribosylpyrophosphate synthetase n=1 Tax=Sphingobacterium sp. UT-1RO-CII-1 TaxID=2995225 RepID=UPI00227CD3DE|nr:phosphoribosylpyrophosphate synthetase [Sphingobacterium sp. UT-1RO-CII-1]MCY4779899.1 phosphoribosylpyrophosphate synthetase [Sphingobacterium sp. UT-1RO-CII-1]
MKAMTSLSDILDKLRTEGYTLDFNVVEDHMVFVPGKTKLDPNQFKIDRYFRFEGQSDPDDQAIVYAISSKDGKQKGVLVNSYGLYSDEATNKIISLLEQQED